jgi:hypothetical protein
LSNNHGRSNIDRLAARGATRILERASESLPDAVQRADLRSGGASLTRAPDSVEVIAQTGAEVGPGDAQAMRSQLALEISELVSLSAERGLLRKIMLDAARAEAPAQTEPAAGATPLLEWWQNLEAQGLKKPEIEELLVDRLRSLRRGMLALDASRRVGR